MHWNSFGLKEKNFLPQCLCWKSAPKIQIKYIKTSTHGGNPYLAVGNNSTVQKKSYAFWISMVNSKVQMCPAARWCVRKFLSLCSEALPPSESASAVSAMNPTESKVAIKIPSCHKKPLRRAEGTSAGQLEKDSSSSADLCSVSFHLSREGQTKLPCRPGSTQLLLSPLPLTPALIWD